MGFDKFCVPYKAAYGSRLTYASADTDIKQQSYISKFEKNRKRW